MSRLRMAVIGVGHLGKEHARILAGLDDVELVGVADVSAEQGQAVARRVGATAYTDYWPLLNLIDAAVVAAPTAYHHAIASEFLKRGISLLVEKPLASTLAEAERLVELSQASGATLQVGHIERFNPAFEDLITRPIRPKFVTCERMGTFTGRSTDIGVTLDLMIHDLDLLLTLVRSPVRSVEAVGLKVLSQHEDVANARLHFANGCIATVTASRVSHVPLRCMHVWSAEGYVRLDYQKRQLRLVQPSEQLRRQEMDIRKMDAAGLGRLKEELFARHFRVQELDRNEGDQLTRELRHFVDCVRTGATPRVSGSDGVEAIALATRVLDSMAAHAWEGHDFGPRGPMQMPAPAGMLFPLGQEEAAA